MQFSIQTGRRELAVDQCRVDALELRLPLPARQGAQGCGIAHLTLSLDVATRAVRAERLDVPAAACILHQRLGTLHRQPVLVQRPGQAVAQVQLALPVVALGLDPGGAAKQRLRRAGPQSGQVQLRETGFALEHRLGRPGADLRRYGGAHGPIRIEPVVACKPFDWPVLSGDQGLSANRCKCLARLQLRRQVQYHLGPRQGAAQRCRGVQRDAACAAGGGLHLALHLQVQRHGRARQ